MDAPHAVVGRSAAVLRVVATGEPQGLNTSQVARDTGLPRSSAHRLLGSLEGEGLVDRLPDSGLWVLGPELFFLGSAAARRYDVTALAAPVLRRLALATGESAFLSARRGEETICLLREDGSFPIRSHVLHEGIRFPLGVASAGLAILAHLPDAEVERYLATHDPSVRYGTPHASAYLRRRIRDTRRLGYAVNPGLIVKGSWGMGAAVFDTDDRPGWALSLTGVEQRFSAVRRRELGPLLLREAHGLSKLLRSPRPARAAPLRAGRPHG